MILIIILSYDCLNFMHVCIKSVIVSRNGSDCDIGWYPPSVASKTGHMA